jgi:hypothetical protein
MPTCQRTILPAGSPWNVRTRLTKSRSRFNAQMRGAGVTLAPVWPGRGQPATPTGV